MQSQQHQAQVDSNLGRIGERQLFHRYANHASCMIALHIHLGIPGYSPTGLPPTT